MDIVDTFNHLIPSDQLDDSLLIGQNLECEAITEFGTDLHHLEDSLKNMLSDKDPMFGSASSQFNLLDNDETNFQIASSTGLNVVATSGISGTGGDLTCAETPKVKRPVGRPRKHPRIIPSEQGATQGPVKAKTPGRKAGPRRIVAGKQQKSSSWLKQELALGGSVNVHDLTVERWLNPFVLLRRLTVTVGGFRIELLPGPSYAASVDTGQAIGLEDGLAYSGGVEISMVQEDTVTTMNPVEESPTEAGVVKKSPTEDQPSELGPYVNPNEVQASNGPIKESPALVENKVKDQDVSAKGKPVGEGKAGIKKPQHPCNNKVNTVSKVDDGKKKIILKKQFKSEQGPKSVRNKNLVSGRPSNIIKGPKTPQCIPSKTPNKDGHNAKPFKEKKGPLSLKRIGGNTQTESPAKIQRLQDGGTPKPKPKSPGTSTSPVKKVPDSRLGEHPKPAKSQQPHTGPKPEGTETAPNTPGHPLPTSKKPPDEAGSQDKSKVKKPEKILQRQKSKNTRSISVDEPQLFIPDNAPVGKKDTPEEQAANSEAVWDGSNSCGLCKKSHNNMFMVGCGRCDDWFHGDCVGLDLGKVQQMEEEDQMYVCLKCCAEETTKPEPETKQDEQPKAERTDSKQAPKPKQPFSQPLTSGGVRSGRKDSERRHSTEAQRTGLQKQETKSKISSPPSKKPVSGEEIRRSVRDSLKEILLQRLKDSDLKIPTDKASEVAKKTERELFHLYKDTDSKYKSKYRSLMFNLKDTKNNVLFKRVLRGEISPHNLVRLSPEELASKELAAWRQRENRHTIEMIEKEQREVERRPITKITHKGEIEIESQEPVKAPETIEVVSEPIPKVVEDPEESPPVEKKMESNSDDKDKDTTSLHKSHLFDIHCKICTGRMAPPVEEAPTKVVKVATTVARRQSSTAEESKGTPQPVKDEDLHLSVLEESLLKAKALSSYEGRSEYSSGRDDEANFLSNLKSLWRGFVNMPAVAKLVTKVFPVSGIYDNLSQDLPDCIQVGGRISPQIVWDYFEKIRATGTKEVCLIRFSPETEEDEISYTLLYAYFSSRKRFGVVANNRKLVKDMYLIPLGASEKVPHQLVPFDGPGLEANRSNLLLGLIIRQRPKRDFLPVDLNETARFIPESKPINVSPKDTQVKDEENFYLNALTSTIKKEKENPLGDTEEVDESVTESFEDISASEETNSQEPKKPLRFLPGVLLGLGGLLPPLPDVGGQPILAVDDPPKNQQASKILASTTGNSTKAAPAAPRLDRFIIKKKEAKPAKAEPGQTNLPETSSASNSLAKDDTTTSPGAPVSLKDKPPDMSTEAFLASLPNRASGNGACGDVHPSSETGKANPEENLPKSDTASDQTPSSKPPLSGILKKSSAYPISTNEKNTEVTNAVASQLAPPMNPQPVTVVSSVRNDPTPASQHGSSQPCQAAHGVQEAVQSRTALCSSEIAEPKTSQTGSSETAVPLNQGGPQAGSSLHSLSKAPTPQYQSAIAPTIPAAHSNSSPSTPQKLPQQQVTGNNVNPVVPPENTCPHPQDQNHATLVSAPDGPVIPPPLVGQPSQHQSDSSSESSSLPASSAKDYKGPDDSYSDPWERTRSTAEQDHSERHRHSSESHHAKKSRHHDRERSKKYERSSYEDKHRDRSRHHGYSKDDHHSERRKERHHSDDYSSRHKDRDRDRDRHRHRRDSDYEKGRRSPKDRYS